MNEQHSQPGAVGEEAPLSIRGVAISIVSLGAITVLTLLAVDALGGSARLGAWVKDAGAWAPVVFVALKTLTYVIAPLSGTALKVAAGAIFGLAEGIALSLLGDALGGSLNYWIARRFGRPLVVRLVGRDGLAQVDRLLARARNWRTLLLIRTFLAGIYDFISYSAGLIRIPFGQFLAVTVLGGVLPVAVVVSSGAAFEGDPALLVATYAGVLLVVGIAELVRRRWTR